mmetsp:Transcript_22774/g.31828  ORF Transcript_22774/g.31828 Transcript_22774/m.31828 type:complete len:239 (+) Transcript_22774:29-745(+)
MSQELRQRSGATTTVSNEVDDLVLRSDSGLSASSMMAASPSQSGKVMKLHVPALYSLCPAFIQRLLLSWNFLSFLAPTWKERHLILIGDFLYKFNQENSSLPKGTPFSIETIESRVCSNNAKYTDERDFALNHLPPGYQAVFIVSTLRRRHYYAVSSREECSTWVQSLADARQEKIKRSMGHAGNMPYPRSWEYFDSRGRSLLKSKERIKAKIEETHVKEMEMTNFAEGGPMPRGYYG